MRIFRNVLIAGLALAAAMSADEGMWLFHNPPRKVLEDKYHFNPSPEWLDHLQKSAVRFDNGGSGSFVSPDGLVMTNHHVASDCIQKIGSAGKDYIQSGFEAPSRNEEAKCPDLELDVLESTQDVTARVNGAVKDVSDPAAAQKARRAAINSIEKESQDATGLRSDVVTLYNGGEYQLYRYKRYTDVRLVFAPEKSIAAFGGDPDNFEYPRYDLDIAFFRVYENNQPVHVKDYLAWEGRGPKEGDLTFIPGNPGTTSRLDTVDHLKYLRDTANPYVMDILFRQEIVLRTFSERGIENARRAQDELLSVQNSRKAYIGMEGGLQDPALMAQKSTEEQKLRDAVLSNAKLREADGNAWQQIDGTLDIMRGIYKKLDLLEGERAFSTSLFDIARTLVRLAEESRKPNADRLREFSESQLEQLKQQLFSPAPIYDDLEIAKLTDSLSFYAGVQGEDDELVRKVLAGKSPADRAAELVQGTRLKDVAVRKQLADGGLAAIEASSDPMIQLARLVDPPARELRKTYEEKVQEPRRQAYAKISNARFALYGTSTYPDATFTLRLAFGEVKGYVQQGKQIPWSTNFGGLYERAAQHDSIAPFNLPQRWVQRKSSLNLSTPFDFVNTADIIGGNSGSPVVNREGQLVGIVFDGNLQSLVLDYTYTDKEARAIAVDSAAIVEALRKVYGANWLLTELGVK